MKKKKELYGWIWYRDDFSKDPPVIRLMREEFKPKRIWNINSNGGIKQW